MIVGARRFKTRYEGFNRAVKIWTCKHCNLWHEKDKPSRCTNCGSVNFHYLASKAEAKRYGELLLRVRIGEIKNLGVQISYPLKVNGVWVTTYRADFVYKDCKTGDTIVEDVKAKSSSHKAITDVFKIKAKLMGAIYGIEIKIVQRS